MKDLVRGDRMFAAREFGDIRPAAGRDQYALGGDFRSVRQPHLLRTDDGRACLEHRDLVVVERLTIKTLEPVALGEHLVAQPRTAALAVGTGHPTPTRVD